MNGQKKTTRTKKKRKTKNNKKKQKNMFSKMIILCCFVVFVMIIMSSPIFSIEDVEILGNNMISESEIKTSTGILENENIFAVGTKQAQNAFDQNAYIRSIKVKKNLPNKVTIIVDERKPRAYLERKNMGNYVLIDEEGMILGVENFVTENLPVIVGIDYLDFVIGEIYESDDDAEFKTIVLLSQLFLKYEMDDVVRVDIKDKDDIHLYMGNVDVLFGSIIDPVDADEKIRITIKCIEALKEREDDPKGFLYVKDLDSDIYFKPLK